MLRIPCKVTIFATIILYKFMAEVFYDYFVFMLDHEDEEDGVMTDFGLTYHEDFSAYLKYLSK